MKTASVAALVRGRIGAPPARRLVTGTATLDTIARGGLPEGKLVLYGGAPGAGKTTRVVQDADTAARAGWSVLVDVADGSIEDVVQRFAQLHGVTRDEWDANNAEALSRFADEIEPLALEILDADTCPFVEDASALLKAKRGGAPSLLIIDSAQQVRSRAGDIADGPRARLDANLAALKRAARTDAHLVIATSELARGAYRNKNSADQIDDLAAFKESGALEYAADLALVLRNVRDEEDLVDVTIPKSRLGERTPFRMRLDRRHMRFTEIAVDVEEEERQRDAAHDNRGAEDVAIVERYLATHPGTPGLRALRTGLRADHVKISNPRLDVALVRLADRIENRGAANRPRWFLRPIGGEQ